MMNMKKSSVLAGLIVVFVVAFVSTFSVGIDHTLEHAEQLTESGHYATAWRLLYDRMKRPNGKEAANALDRLEWMLLHDDRSALMQDLRDPNRSILEKRNIVSEIVDAVEGNLTVQSQLLKNHNDPFVQVMLSPKLPPDEKIELIIRIRALVERHYIALEEQEDLQKQVYRLQTLAAEQLRHGQYRLALKTLQEAAHMRDMLPYFKADVTRLIGEAVKLFLQHDPAPLTVLLRNPHVSFLDKRTVLIELQKLLYDHDASREIVIQKQRYMGSFIDLIRDAGYKTGSLIWASLKDALEDDDLYHGKEITPELARSAFPDYDHQPVFPLGISFHSLQSHYKRDYVEIILQGTVPPQHLQELYVSLGFTSEMFTSQLKYADKSLLSHYWNVTLKNVWFADFIIEETESKVWGALVFAYQEDEQGQIQFYLSYYTS